MRRNRRLNIFWLLAAGAWLWAPPAYSQRDPNTNEDLLSYMSALALPTNPLVKGALDLKLVPAYAEYNDRLNGASPQPGQLSHNLDTSGYGVGVSANYSLTNHFGVSAVAAMASMSGHYFDGQSLDDKGCIASANLVFDPFSGDNFRLPLMVGLGYVNDVTQQQSTPGVWRDVYAAKHPVVPIGLAPQFNTGFIRWVGFLYGAPDWIAAKNYEMCGPSNSTTCNGGGGGAQAGISVIYRPWDIGLTYILPGLFNNGHQGESISRNIFSLTIQHRFKLKSQDSSASAREMGNKAADGAHASTPLPSPTETPPTPPATK